MFLHTSTYVNSTYTSRNYHLLAELPDDGQTAEKLEGPVTLCNFLSNLSRNALRNKLLRKLHSVTGGFLTFFFGSRNVARSRLLFATHCSNFQRHCTVYHPSATFLAIFEELYSIVHTQSLFTSTTILNLAPNNSP